MRARRLAAGLCGRCGLRPIAEHSTSSCATCLFADACRWQQRKHNQAANRRAAAARRRARVRDAKAAELARLLHLHT
jgi:ribosomal protein L37E